MATKRFNITKEQFKNLRDEAQWDRFVRKFELDKIFEKFSEGHFDKALELGCGSGKHSRHLAFYCKKLIALEYNENRLTADNDKKTTFVVGDAQDLSQFGDSEMDLVFSSNLIEHLPRLTQCLAECSRVVKQDGLIVHTVPNRTWKIFNVLLYYPLMIKRVCRCIFSTDKTAKPKVIKPRLDNNLRVIVDKYSFKQRLLPPTHGISKSHISEFLNWGQKRWISIFEKNNLEVVDIIRLPFYFGWGYNFRILLRLGNYLHLSSSTAFVLKKISKPRPLTQQQEIE